MEVRDLVSVCCSSKVIMEMSPDFLGDKPKEMTIGTANYYCTSCWEACDTKVKFDEESVKKYLDSCIVYWRDKREKYFKKFDYISGTMAIHYVDAYQSMRVSLFGELLSEEIKKEIPGPQMQV